MSDAKHEQTDKLADQLKQSLARRRPRPWKLVLGAMAVSIALLLLLAWWMYPRTPLTPLQILALDAVVPADGELQVHAQLVLPTDEPARSLHGRTLHFMGPQMPGKGADPAKQFTAKSDARGHAVVDWPRPEPPLGEFLVKSMNDSEKPSPPDAGRIFVWPRDAPILLVDVDETLNVAEPEKEALATLRKAEENGWRIVYLSMAGPDPREFRKTHLAVQRPSALPKGPIVGRFHVAETENHGAVRRQLLESFRSRFKGSMQAVVKTSASAAICREVGLRTILIGAEAPAEVLAVASWTEVPLRLE
jgi:hypothetical protein